MVDRVLKPVPGSRDLALQHDNARLQLFDGQRVQVLPRHHVDCIAASDRRMIVDFHVGSVPLAGHYVNGLVNTVISVLSTPRKNGQDTASGIGDMAVRRGQR